MRKFILYSLILTLTFAAKISAEESRNPGNQQSLLPPMTGQDQLIRRSPESQGIASKAILAFIEDAEANIDALHSVMLLRHGYVVAEGWWTPYGPEYPHELYSLSKSFTSTAIGMAIEEGLIEINDPVLKFFPDEAPEEPGDNLKQMRVRQLLSMSTGHTQGTLGAMRNQKIKSWAAAFLAQEVTHKPGTYFMYNTGATYMLSAIITKQTGLPLLDYLGPRLFEPLGIVNPTWQTDPQGINAGGYGLNVKTEDIARLGQLYLQKGMWRGKQLLTEAWIDEATSRQVSNGNNPESDWDQGYGYQFWRCRHGLYRGDGAFGQYCIVMPEQDAVLAITSGVRDMQQVMNVAWEHLLPAMTEATLPEDEIAARKLENKLQNLTLQTQSGKVNSPTAGKVNGKTFTFDLGGKEREIQAIAFDFDKTGCDVILTDSRGVHKVRCGFGQWIRGKTAFESGENRAVAASGAWTAEDTYVMKLCYYETPFMSKISCRFTDKGVLYDYEANVGFGDLKRPRLTGLLK